MGYDFARWTASPVSIVGTSRAYLPMVVLTAPDVMSAINEDAYGRGASGAIVPIEESMANALSRAFQHAVAVGALTGWWPDGDRPTFMPVGEIAVATAENGAFRSAMHDKGIVVATPGERIDGCRVGSPVLIPERLLNLRLP